MSLLEIENLKIGTRHKELVKGIDLTIEPGEWVALIGESGSGKSITSMSVGGLLAPNLRRSADSLTLDGTDLMTASKKILQRIRGEKVAYVFQDYQGAFTPYYRIGEQLHEMLRAHRRWDHKKRAARIAESLNDVGLEVDLSHRYPFQVSGGQLQRIALAAAMLLEPDLLIADEPTTALDAWSAGTVLEHMARIKEEKGCAILFITHDLRIMRRHADRVAIMREGSIVEHGTREQVVEFAEHPYTRDLLASIPPMREIPDRLPIRTTDVEETSPLALSVRSLPPSDTPALQAKNLTKTYGSGTVAVADVSLELASGTCLGLVGESGSGKSTLARCILTLERLDEGEVRLLGESLNDAKGARLRAARQRMQVVLQNPNASFNGRLTIMDSLLEPLECAHLRAPSFLPDARTPREVAEGLLQLVRLPAEYLDKRPHQLSGGEKQRVAIARAISTEPGFIVLDEPTASLDASTQARVLNLLKDLQANLGLSYLFISHDLSSVQFISHHVMVMKEGRIVDEFDRESVFAPERHSYTRQLVRLFDDSPRVAA